MKIRILLLSVLCLVATHADLFGTTMQMVTSGSSPEAQEKLMSEGVVPYVFDMLTTTSIKEFPIQNGRFTNIEIKVIPPDSFDDVQTEIMGDALMLKIGGIGVILGADFEILIKNRPATGHVKAHITDLGVHIKLRNEPRERLGDRRLGADVQLDLTKTVADVKFTTEGNVEEVRDYLFGLIKKQATASFQSQATSWVPEWAQNFGWGGSKVGGLYEPINYMLDMRTQEIFDEFSRTIPNLSEAVYKMTHSSKLSPHTKSHSKSLVNFGDAPFLSQTSPISSIKSLLAHNQYKFSSNPTLTVPTASHSGMHNFDHKDSLSMAGKIDDSQESSTLDKDVIKKILQKELSSKSQQASSGELKYSCTPKSTEPTLSGSKNEVIGTFLVECTLMNGNEELYKTEMELEFTVHPDEDDGKSYKADFGKIHSSDMMPTRDGNTKITTRISDKDEMDALFPGFGGIFGNLFEQRQMQAEMWNELFGPR